MTYITAHRFFLEVTDKETFAKNASKTYYVATTFSNDWNDLNIHVTFRSGDSFIRGMIDSSGVCSIPDDALQYPGETLYIGLTGTKGRSVIIPTAWVSLGIVHEETDDGTHSGGGLCECEEATDVEILDIMVETDILNAITNEDGAILTDDENNPLLWG